MRHLSIHHSFTPLLLSIASLAAGCNSGSPCDRACRHIADCLGIDLDAGGNAGWQCPVEGECSGDRQCVGRCFEEASCEAITGQDSAATATLGACQLACTSSSEDDARPPDARLQTDASTADASGSLDAPERTDTAGRACTSQGCPPGHYCDIGAGECLPGCAVDTDCGDAVCNVTTHACCESGEQLCGGECVDTDADARHCGGCGNDCPAELPECTAGQCSTGCAPGDENTVAACSDGCSNDGDKFVDCDDYDCCPVRSCPADTACGQIPPGCDFGPENTVAACSDGCSNDSDPYVDCDDYDCCAVRPDCPPESSCGAIP